MIGSGIDDGFNTSADIANNERTIGPYQDFTREELIEVINSLKAENSELRSIIDSKCIDNPKIGLQK